MFIAYLNNCSFLWRLIKPCVTVLQSYVHRESYSAAGVSKLMEWSLNSWKRFSFSRRAKINSVQGHSQFSFRNYSIELLNSHSICDSWIPLDWWILLFALLEIGLLFEEDNFLVWDLRKITDCWFLPFSCWLSPINLLKTFPMFFNDIWIWDFWPLFTLFLYLNHKCSKTSFVEINWKKEAGI